MKYYSDMKNQIVVNIIDDEENDSKAVEEILNQLSFSLEVTFQVFIYQEYKQECLENQCNLYIIDVRLKNEDGFEVAQNIKNKNPDCKIIMYTNYNQLVFHAFQYDVFGFIRKDHMAEDTEKMILKYIKTDQSFYSTKEYEIPLSKILYFETSHNYLLIHLSNGEILKERKRLKALEESEMSGFCKISSSFMLNLKYIKCCEKSEVTLENGEQFFISKAKINHFYELYAKYILEN